MSFNRNPTQIIQIARDRFGLGFVLGALFSAVVVIATGIAFRLMREDPASAVVAAIAQPASADAGTAGPHEAMLPYTEVSPPWATSAPEAKAAKAHAFAVPKSLTKRVAFWTDVWSTVPGHEHLLVDSRIPWLVHARVRCAVGSKIKAPACQQKISGALKKVKSRLRKLARRPTRKHRRTYGNDKAMIKSASASIIRVSGKKDALQRALARAGDHIFVAEQIFAAFDVPPALTRVAVVESLYRSGASSRASAVGAFQFTANTAREYIAVDKLVDERLDPTRSAYAAALYLIELKASLRRWGLALTAYNTGPTRMKRLIKKHDTYDLGKLMVRAEDERFGFDGQNYYAQVLAVISATSKVESPLVPWPTLIKLDSPMSLGALARALGHTDAALRTANPALLKPITSGKKPIPVSYLVNVPTAGPAVSNKEKVPDEKRGT